MNKCGTVEVWALIEKAYNMQQPETVQDERGLDIWNCSSFGVIFALWATETIDTGLYEAIKDDLELIYKCRVKEVRRENGDKCKGCPPKP
jgi:hypothetical protein